MLLIVYTFELQIIEISCIFQKLTIKIKLIVTSRNYYRYFKVKISQYTDLIKLCYKSLSEWRWLTVHVELQEELN